MSKKLFLLPFLALGLMFASCDKENTDNTGDNNGGNTTGQALNLDLNYDQVQGWLGQPGTAVENQLIQMGFTRMDKTKIETENVYYTKTINATEEYRCMLVWDENGTVLCVNMSYEATGTTCTFNNTVATFKKYSEQQNLTFSSSQSVHCNGEIIYYNGVEYTKYDYETYDELITALVNTTQHNCTISWTTISDGFSLGTAAEYHEEDGEKFMGISIDAMLILNDK